MADKVAWKVSVDTNVSKMSCNSSTASWPTRMSDAADANFRTSAGEMDVRLLSYAPLLFVGLLRCG
jgi:hypothetical protein